MVEANRFAICFLSVISFPLTFKWSKEDADFFPLIFLNAFQTVLGLVFDVSEEQKLCRMFSLSFYYMSGFGFQLLKSKYIFCSRVSKKFPLSFLTFFNSLFTNIVKPRYFRKFVFRNVGFGNSLVRNLNQSICSSLTSKTKPKPVWRAIRKIKGKKSPSSLGHLKVNWKLITDKKQIANLLASAISSNSSYNTIR